MSTTHWQCIQCTLLNNWSALRCIVCDKRRPRNYGNHCDQKKTPDEDNPNDFHEEKLIEESSSCSDIDNNKNETDTESESQSESQSSNDNDDDNKLNKEEVDEEPEYESSSDSDSGSSGSNNGSSGSSGSDNNNDDMDETDTGSQSQSQNVDDVTEKQKKRIIADDESDCSISDEAEIGKSDEKMEEKEDKLMLPLPQKVKKRRKRDEYSKMVIRRDNDHLQIWLKISHLLPALDTHSLQSQRKSIVNLFGTNKDILLFLVEHCNEKQIIRLNDVVQQKEFEIHKIKVTKHKKTNTINTSNKINKLRFGDGIGKLFREQLVLHHICGYLKRENIKYFKPCSAHIAVVGLREMQKYSISVCNINDILVQEQSDDINKEIVTNNDKYINSDRFVSNRYYSTTRYYTLYEEWSKQYHIPTKDMLVYEADYRMQLFNLKEHKYNFIVAKQRFIIFDKRKMVKITEKRSKLLNETYRIKDRPRVENNSKIIILKYFDIKRQKSYNVQCLLFDKLTLLRCTVQRLKSYIENEFLWLDCKWCNFLKDIKQPLLSVYNRWNRALPDSEDDKKINDVCCHTINFITFQVVDVHAPVHVNEIINEVFKLNYPTYDSSYHDKQREDSPTPKSRIVRSTSYKSNNFVYIKRCNIHLQMWIKMRYFINNLDNQQLNSYKNYIFKKFFGNHTKRIVRFYVQYASKEKLYKIYEIIKDIEPQNVNVNVTKKKKKKKKKKQFVSFDNLLPFTTIHHICGYLRRSDVSKFKLVSYSIAIVCLEAMQKILIGICNTNEIFKEINRNSSKWRDLMKFYRHHCKKQYFALFSEWEHYFNVAEKYQLIYDFHNNNAWKIDLKKDIETVIHSKQWFILFDLRNIILLQKQTIKSIADNSALEDENKIIVLKYFDIHQQKIYISQIIMVDANVTARRILEYIEHQFINQQTTNWHNSLKSSLSGMLYDGNQEKLTMYVNGTLVDDIDCKIGAFYLKQAVTFVTFQLNIQHSYFNDDKMNEIKTEYEHKHLLTWHHNMHAFEKDNNIIRLTINYLNGAQTLRRNVENYLRSKATININKDAILHNAGMEMKIFVKKHVKYESIKLKISQYLFNIVSATNIELYNANSLSNESNASTIGYSESIVFDFVEYNTFLDSMSKCIARIYTPKQCPYPIHHTKDIQKITFRYDTKNNNKILNIKQDIVNKIFNESTLNPVYGKQFHKIIKLHLSGHIIYVIRRADNWGRWSDCYGINEEIETPSYISYRFIDIFLLKNHNCHDYYHNNHDKCLLLIKFVTKKAKITSKLKPSDLKDSMFVGLPLIIYITKKHSLMDIINKYILQFTQYIDCTYKIDKTNSIITVIKKNVRDKYFPYEEFINNDDNENYMIFSFKNIDTSGISIQQFTGKIMQSLSI